MKKKISMLIIIMLLCISTVLVVNKDVDVEAAGGGDDGTIGKSIGLDLDFMWDVTNDLSNVIHDAYEEGEIRKGRDFGTKGDHYAANIIQDYMENTTTNLENVTKIPIKQDTGMDCWKYNYKVDVIDFNLTINGDGYPFPKQVPKNETYAYPTGALNRLLPPSRPGFGKMDYNHSFQNLLIVPLSFSSISSGFDISYLNISCDSVNEIIDFMGNSTYIPINESIPEDQECYLYLLEEEDGVEDQLDNITNNASIVILIHNYSKQDQYYANTSNCNFSIGRANNSDSNLTTVIEMLQNGTLMIVDNFLNGNETFTFSYDFNYDDRCFPWGSDDFFYVYEHDPYEYYSFALVGTRAILLRNTREYYGLLGSDVLCHGIIGYDISYETHLMWVPRRHWQGWTNSGDPWWELFNYGVKYPFLQMFFVNKSVGEWLEENCSDPDTSVSGYFEQADNWVDAYNVIGNITIDHSPNDNITIISNRYDGWWSEAPGDSGLGAGIVLGIAKYFTDYNIKPKCNLTFLFTTGEEWGMRGAWHYNHSHLEKDYNITRWIGTDQLGFNESGSYMNPLVSDNTTTGDIIEAIANETNYESRTGYGFMREEAGGGIDDFAIRGRKKEVCDTICIHKNKDPYWFGHHRAGMNYQEGDSMKYINRTDANVTFEYAWNITKYFTVNPDCWLTNVTYQAFDSEKDGDNLDDSIRANFTLNTILPHDNVMVELFYIKYTEGGAEDPVIYGTMDYSVTCSGKDVSYVFTIPDEDVRGNYSILLRLYNSTGKINKIVGIGSNNYNDSDSSNTSQLYHAFGNPKKGILPAAIKDKIRGSVFTTNQDGYVYNITAFVTTIWSSNFRCMIYRANDSKLIGATEERCISLQDSGWNVFPFLAPTPYITNDTEYIITCWSDGVYSSLFYKFFNGPRGRRNNTAYGDPPDYPVFTNNTRLYSLYCGYGPDTKPPEITDVSATPDVVGFGFNVTIGADVIDNGCGVDTVTVNITYPDNSTGNFTMNNTGNDTYEYVFNDTWENGQYSYMIWADDLLNNSNSSSGHSFDVSVDATISVCTIRDSYGDDEIVNLTDPPSGSSVIGYELLVDGDVLRIWNSFDSYYFDTNSGIQLTNHYDDYWSHNVLMLGYYNNDQWNLIYRTDELSGFNKDIESDNETFVNATLWKDLSYGGYDFRLAIRYHLGVDDNELTVIPYIKNIDSEDIPYNLGFAWRIKDIQIDMTTENDYINVNRTMYYLNQTLDNVYTDLPEPEFYLMENITDLTTKSLYLKWNQSLVYKLEVKSREGQYNAPVTLFIKIGTLNEGQQKYTELFWYDAEQITYFFDSYDDAHNGEAWETFPEKMVDGSTSYFASTTIDGDIELCDENNCSGDDLGTISKVEIRCYGYYSGGQRDTILRPVYGGTNDGMECRYQTPPAVGGGWSEWFDITYGPYAPQPWGWNDIVSLDCDVEAENDPMGPPFTLYCSMVEIRVTYTPYNYDPVISDPVPIDGATGVSIQPVLNITVSDADGDNMNITWFSNSSGSWQFFGTNSSVGNGTYHQIMGNASENGKWWYWKVNVTDSESYTESNVYKFYTGYQSKIKNTGSTNIKGYLLIQVQYFNETSESWVVADDTVNETTPRIINSGGQLGLDTIFNGLANTQNLSSYGNGTYRIYVAFRNPDGNILVTDNETELMATYEFTVTFD